MATKGKKSNTVKVNFKGVQAGGKLVPEGDYTVKVDEVTQEESDAGNAYLAWILKVADGKHKGSTLYHNTSLQPQALWNLKGVLEALGVEVPDSSLDIDLGEVIGMTANVTVEHETYQGKPKARIVAWESATGGEDEEAEGEEEGGVTIEDVNGMDDEELEALVENNELDVKLSKLKNIKARRAAVIEALGLNETEESDEGDEEAAEESEDEEEGEEADGEDEGESEGYSDEDINGLGKSELAALVKEHKLKVTLEGTTAQQRRLVKKALIRAELFNAEEA